MKKPHGPLQESAPVGRRHDIIARRPVWEALSSLFLDADPATAYAWRVKVLAESPYAIDMIQDILVNEVYPVCVGNLRSVAGPWSGFDMGQIEERILRRRQTPWRWWRHLHLGYWFVRSSEAWRATRQGVEQARRLRDPGGSPISDDVH